MAETFGWTCLAPAATTGTPSAASTHSRAAVAQLDANTLYDRGVIIAGNPESCIKNIRMYDEVGVDQCMFIIQTETIPHERVMESIEMFGKHVLPVFAKEREQAVTAD